MKRFITLVLAAVLFMNGYIMQTPQASAVSAADWKAGRIIDDSKFTGLDMSVAEIQSFLDYLVPNCDTNGTQPASEYDRPDLTHAQYAASRGWPGPPYVCLKNYYEVPKTSPGLGIPANNYSGSIPPSAVSAAQMIYDAARRYNISPKILLVKLDTESAGPLTRDKWPLQKQYTYAMGAHCPDSGSGGSANCDANYAGFSLQIAEAAKLLRWYLDSMTQSWWQYKKPYQNNYVLWNVEPRGCGGTDIYLESMGTAALYTYTPYQPNQAALNNMYGTGDNCSAYGNRNFWRVYNDWFGPTNNGVQLVKSPSSPTVFALYDGIRQGIPSPDSLYAWGLASLPIAPISDASLATIPDAGPLTRVMKNPYNPALFLVGDSGGTFDALGNMVGLWGYDPNTVATVRPGLIAYTKRLGGLTPFMTSASAGGIYMIDGGQKRIFSSPTQLRSWAGDNRVITISDTLFQALPAGPGIISNQGMRGTTDQFIVTNGTVLSLDANTSQLYPRDKVQSISDALFSILPSGGQASKFIRDPNGTIYLLDDRTKHGFSSLGLLRSYANSDTMPITQLSSDEAATIPSGQNITTRFAFSKTTPTSQYYVNFGRYSVPQNFSVHRYGFAISDTGIQAIGSNRGPISCTQGLIQAVGSPGVSILDDGIRRGFSSPQMLSLVNNNSGNVCVLNTEDVTIFPQGPPISPVVTNNGTTYLTEKTKRFSLSPSSIVSLGSPQVQPVSAKYIALFSDGGPMSEDISYPGGFGLLLAGKAHTTPSATIARLWGIDASKIHSAELVSYLGKGTDLIPFAHSSDPTNGCIYIVDQGKFLPIGKLTDLFNAGFAMQKIPSIPQQLIDQNTGSVWQGYLALDATTNQKYVLEAGNKHLLPANLESNWLGTSGAIIPTTLSSDFLSLLRTAGSATKSIETNAPGIYAMVNGQKSGIPNTKTYSGLYAPSTLVSRDLISSIPTGPEVPSL